MTYLEIEKTTKLTLTGSDIYNEILNGITVFKAAHTLQSWENEMYFKESVRKWVVQMVTYTDGTIHLNVNKPLHKNSGII